MQFTETLAVWLSDHLSQTGLALFAILFFWRIRKSKKQVKVAKKILKKAIDTQTHEPMTLHPEIENALCAGCGSCTRVCPEGDILRLIDHKAVLVSPTKCVGHGECETACPTGAISLVFGTKTRGMEIPRITGDYETNVPGLYIAGELGGMGLIKNAIKQGHLAATHALKNIKQKGDRSTYDLLVVGAGPAGMAASLTAIAEKSTYICIDQNSYGGTVYNFPRQKIVTAHPVDFPIVGKMKFKSNIVSKEELLAYWNEVRSKTGLKVNEKVAFESMQKVGDTFEVKTSAGVLKAKKVILCMGVRGSPRKLGLPQEDLPKVAYNLIDPEQYQGKEIVVVGGGNAGVEAAQYLGKPMYKNKVRLLVRGATFDRCNEMNKQIIEEMAAKGQVQICYNSSVTGITADTLNVKLGEKAETIKNDYLFVFAGAEMPFKFLMSLGINIDKKHGEKVKKSNAS